VDLLRAGPEVKRVPHHSIRLGEAPEIRASFYFTAFLGSHADAGASLF
jgi:hypothetical protein